MRYRVKIDQTHLYIIQWALLLNNPLVLVKWEWGRLRTTGHYCIIASGSGETMLLLKYGHALEQVLCDIE